MAAAWSLAIELGLGVACVGGMCVCVLLCLCLSVFTVCCFAPSLIKTIKKALSVTRATITIIKQGLSKTPRIPRTPIPTYSARDWGNKKTTFLRRRAGTVRMPLAGHQRCILRSQPSQVCHYHPLSCAFYLQNVFHFGKVLTGLGHI